jgi:ketosteroid isomerase-like protein
MFGLQRRVCYHNPGKSMKPGGGKGLPNDLIYTHATGIIDDKAAYIEKLKSKRQKYDGIIHSNVRVKVFGGDTAILTARMRMHGTNQSGAFDDQLLLIHVWVKLNGSWQLAAHQTTKLQ